MKLHNTVMSKVIDLRFSRHTSQSRTMAVITNTNQNAIEFADKKFSNMRGTKPDMALTNNGRLLLSHCRGQSGTRMKPGRQKITIVIKKAQACNGICL